MIDAEGEDANNVPDATPFVGVYVSGTDYVPWTESELSRFPVQRQVRIYQGAGTYPGVGGYDMIDVESEAVTVAQCASEGEKRVQNGYEWTIIYGTAATLALVETALSELGDEIWPGHFYCFLADWNLNATTAAAYLGEQISGMTCIGVQWASPSSNPNTKIPGGTKTLELGNVDLSVVDASELPLPGKVVATPPPPQRSISGMVVYEPVSGPYTSKSVTSTDGGNTWSI